MGVANVSVQQNHHLFKQWMFDAEQQLQLVIPETKIFEESGFTLLSLGSKVCINLIPLKNQFGAQQLIDFQQFKILSGLSVFNLWEDVWHNRQKQVVARIKSLCGLNTKCFARQTKIVVLDTKIASIFFKENHLMGFAKAKYFIGLHRRGELLALAGFSRPVLMKSKGRDYFSAELIRFATLSGTTVTGALSKLIKYFLATNKLNDLMTYADRDWSLGSGYTALGFEFAGETPPQDFYVDLSSQIRYAPHRLPKKENGKIAEPTEDDVLKGYQKVFNIGNLKYYLYT